MKFFNLLIILILILLTILNSQDLISQKYDWNRVFYDDMSTNSFVGIDNFDSLNIMAVEDMSVYPAPGFNRIVKSTDGGMTWDTVYKNFIFKDSLIQALTISYPTKDYCVIGTYKNYIIKTTDGGKNWIPKKLDLPFNHGIREISMYDNQNGIAANLKDLVLTYDGFETYKMVTPPMYGNYRQIAMKAPNEIYVVFWDILKKFNDTIHIVFKTTNEGETWDRIGVIYDPFFSSNRMKFLEKDFGFIVGGKQEAIGMLESNVIYRTKDGGNSWQKVLDTIVPWNAWGIQEIDILDRKTAIATSQFGVVYWTHDGGDSWQLDSSGVLREDKPATLYPCILGKHTALIADFRDRITRSSLKPTDVKEEEDYFKTSGEIIYPNPATDFITINLDRWSPPSRWTPSEIEIYDVMGIRIHSTPSASQPHLNEGNLRIDVSNLSPGVYFVKIGDRVEKFVKY